MTLLLFYILVALGFSFLCSVAEAVLLSVTQPYIALLEKEGHASGKLLREMKADINSPLAAILTLNTIAHTVGAAGAGAQAAVVFGSAWVGVASAVLTLLILIFSEIIPKTLGAHYWRSLAPVTAYVLRWLVLALYPFVLLSRKLTGELGHAPTLRGFSREEFAVMAELGAREGQLEGRESKILKNLFLLRDTPVTAVMTPRPVLFSVPETVTVGAFFADHGERPFSRIPVYADEPDQVTGFVLRGDLMLAQARGELDRALPEFRRELLTLHESLSVLKALEKMVARQAQICLVVDEYGDVEGVVTMEDILETLLGLEIVDESDRHRDMQQLARELWRQRAARRGIETSG